MNAATTTTALVTPPDLDYTVSDPGRPIAGFVDYSLSDMALFHRIKMRVSDVFARFGFTPIELRGIEYSMNLQKKGGVNAQIYGLSSLRSGALTKFALPFDHTVPLAIYLSQHDKTITFPYKRSDIGPVYRGETHAPGRYNEFYQADVDTVAHDLTPLSDAETISTLAQALFSIGVPRTIKILINHVDLAKSFLKKANILETEYSVALQIIDKLKPDNQDDIINELAEKLSGISKECARALIEEMRFTGPLEEFEQTRKIEAVALTALAHLKAVINHCEKMGVPRGTLLLSTSLARGLNYYTGVVFETFIPSKEKYGSIASGGRYDKLVDGFSERQTGLQGVGGSIGLTRLFDIMNMEGMLPPSPQTIAQIFVGYRSLQEQDQAVQIATALRSQGWSVELYTSPKVAVGKELEQCNKKGIPFSVLVMNPTEIVVKQMDGGSHGDASENRQVLCSDETAVIAALRLKLNC